MMGNMVEKSTQLESSRSGGMGDLNKVDKNRYHVECPLFSNVDLDYRIEKETVKRYCHPVDHTIITVLNNPVINSLFKTIADFGADGVYGQIFASGVPVNQANYPDEDENVRDCAETLGIRKPYVVISSSLTGGLNAVTIGSDEEPYIILSSLLVKILTREQLKFVIGHECGHIAMGHVVYHSAVSTMSNFAQYLPLVGPAVFSLIEYPMKAWQRRSEISADRAGLLCCRDLEVAQRTLLQLESAFQNADGLDMTTYVENSRRYLKKGFVRRLGEYGAEHPLIPKRIEALRQFANSRCYYELIGENIPQNALTDKELEAETEKILQVF